jgi:hypothetical protein
MQPPGIQDLHAKEKRFAFSVCGDLQYQTGKSLLPSAGGRVVTEDSHPEITYTLQTVPRQSSFKTTNPFPSRT